MTFKISDFQSEVAGRGLARQNRFQVTIPNTADIRLFQLFCQSASLPGATVQVKKQNLFGPAYIRPANINYGEQISLSFLCDKNMDIRRGFDDWIHQVINKSSFTVAYRSDYARDVYIDQLDEKENITYSIKLVDAFPVSIGALALNQSALDRFHILPVTLAYRYWEYGDNAFNSQLYTAESAPSEFSVREWNKRPPPKPLNADEQITEQQELISNITGA